MGRFFNRPRHGRLDLGGLATRQTHPPANRIFSAGYQRWLSDPYRRHPYKPQPGLRWLLFIGVDLALVSSLQWLQQTGSLNFTPLFGMPILMASVLGTLTLALGTAAAASLLLLSWYWWLGLQGYTYDNDRYLQAAVTGTGYFLIAALANQLAYRLASTYQAAHRNQMDAHTQREVSELVIQNVSDGVLVVDRAGLVRLANPAALLLLGSQSRATPLSDSDASPLTPPFALSQVPVWQPLANVAQQTLSATKMQTADVDILHEDQTPINLRVRAWRTLGPAHGGESLCVMFLHDLRVLQEQLRTEKLAVMGRMSAALAHEFRNPLAAIAQAGQLLDEDLSEPRHQRLTHMVHQNVERLVRVTEDVLEIANVRQQYQYETAMTLLLDDVTRQTVNEWQALDPQRRHVHLVLNALVQHVQFDPEHLRRILVNLLDNALRYCGSEPDSLCVFTHISVRGTTRLEVWSDGAPLDMHVEQHLFEPFSSSQSRSTGLGLYICRELCQRHAASIDYQRVARPLARGRIAGNAFIVTFFRGPDFSPTLPLDSVPAPLV